MGVIARHRRLRADRVVGAQQMPLRDGLPRRSERQEPLLTERETTYDPPSGTLIPEDSDAPIGNAISERPIMSKGTARVWMITSQSWNISSSTTRSRATLALWPFRYSSPEIRRPLASEASWSERDPHCSGGIASAAG